jgi:hypothetical protein
VPGKTFINFFSAPFARRLVFLWGTFNLGNWALSSSPHRSRVLGVDGGIELNTTAVVEVGWRSSWGDYEAIRIQQFQIGV